MDLVVKCKIFGLTKRINLGHGSHWRARHGEARRWLRAVDMAIGPVRPKEPLQKAKLRLTRGSSQEPDFGGLVYSFKTIEDSLVKLGIIIDDKMSVIGRPEYLWEKTKPKEGFIKIEVWRV